MTTSFPYLAIARRHGIDYAEVVRYAQFLDRLRGRPVMATVNDWQRETVLSWVAEQERRKQS